MPKCTVHIDFFDDDCADCRSEYADLKGIHDIPLIKDKSNLRFARDKNKYKDFTEERAKRLYEQLMLQYIGKSVSEQEAAERAKMIIRKQCMIRGIQLWSWV